MKIDPTTVRAAATAVGVDVSDQDVATFRDQCRDAAELVDRFDPAVPEADPATNVTDGTDAHNAYTYQFEAPHGTGPLDDLTVAVKDNMAVAGVPMTCGSAAVDFTPDYDATVTRRLKAAGGDLVGTTNMDEFALTTTGETCTHGRISNPAVDGCVPGGSSSGSGAAVAAGLVDAALGSDTGGSIRIPASFCGVVGFKPTHRSVPRFGFADLSPSLDHVGPLADSVSTACRVLDEIAGPDPNDPSSLVAPTPPAVTDAVGQPIDDLSVAVVEEAMAQSDGGVRETVQTAIDVLEAAGVTVDRVSLPSFSAMPYAVLTIANTELAALIRDCGQVRGTGTGYSDSWRAAVSSMDRSVLGDAVVDSLVVYESLFRVTDGQLYVAAQNARRSFTEAVATAVADVDALLAPTTPMTAFGFGELETTEDLLETIANTSPFNLTGHPALSVPCGEVDGKPVGLQLIGEYHDESVLARLGARLESA